MAFESLASKLGGVFKKLRGKGKLSEQDVKDAMREVRVALLEADVNYTVAKGFIKTVTERCMGHEVMESLTPAQQVIKIVNEELVALMGGGEGPARIHIKSKPPTVIMMCGLQGAGKTTTAAKLAGKFKLKGKKPLLVIQEEAEEKAQMQQLRREIPPYRKALTLPACRSWMRKLR